LKRIFVPTQTGSDWQRLLAKPTLHWKKGRSAMTTAASWEDANDALPKEITAILESSLDEDIVGLKLLEAIPEWQVALEGGETASHTDVLALTRNDRGLCVIAVGVLEAATSSARPTIDAYRCRCQQQELVLITGATIQTIAIRRECRRP
jgi:hypothetical protein